MSKLEEFFCTYFSLKFYEKLSVSALRETRLVRQINQYKANGSKLNILKENYRAKKNRESGEKKKKRKRQRGG